MNIFRKILNLNSEEKKGNSKRYHGVLIERGSHGKLYYSDNNYSIDGDWHDSSRIAYMLQLNSFATKKNQLYEYYDNCPVLILNIADNYNQTKADGIINISDLNSEEYRVYTITDLKSVIHAQIDKFNKSNTDINISIVNNENNQLEIMYRYLISIQNFGEAILPDATYVKKVDKIYYSNDTNATPEIKISKERSPLFDMEDYGISDPDNEVKNQLSPLGGYMNWQSALLFLIQHMDLDYKIAGTTGTAKYNTDKNEWTFNNHYYLDYDLAMRIRRINIFAPIVGLADGILTTFTNFNSVANKIKLACSDWLHIFYSDFNFRQIYNWYILKLHNLTLNQWQDIAKKYNKQQSDGYYGEIKDYHLNWLPEPIDFFDNASDFKSEMFRQGVDITKDELGHTYKQNLLVQQVKANAENKIRKIYNDSGSYDLMLSKR